LCYISLYHTHTHTHTNKHPHSQPSHDRVLPL